MVSRDPRSAPLTEILHAAIATHPDRTELRRDIAERLDYELAANPEAHLNEILDTLTGTLDLTIDYAHPSDHLLDALIPPDTPDDDP